jgi:hypothetical protein
MNDRDQRRYDRATRVQTFGIQNANDYVAGGKARTHYANIDSLMIQLDAAKAGQKPSHTSKTTLFDSLHLDLLNISGTGLRIGRTENGFGSPYRLPDNTSDGSLLTHADSVLLRLEDQPADSVAVKTAKAALRARFIEYELPVDFVAHLRADRKAIADADRANQDEDLDGVENTALINVLLGKINDEIGELDTLNQNKYARQPEKLRAWESASHVERAPQREKKAEKPTQ